MMNAARAKAGRSTSKLVPIVDVNNLPPNPQTLDFSERVDAAIAKPSALIAEAQAQLAAPIVAPKALTMEEKIEARRNSAWDSMKQKKDQQIDAAMESNQKLFEDVMATIDEMEANGDPIPDCSDLLTWDSNAVYTSTNKSSPSSTARWGKGMSVMSLIVKYNG